MTATPDKPVPDRRRNIADLRRQLDAARAELDTRNTAYSERIAYQAAANDVLKVMSDSPGDPQPVFDLIARRARDLCDAYGVTVYEFDGELVHYRVATGVSDDPEVRKAFAALYPMPPIPDLFPHRAILERKVIRIEDLKAEPNPIYQIVAPKSAVAVPLMRGEVAIGALGMGSRERGGFTDSQIELLQTFADQAVIAIENARLFNEVQTKSHDLEEALRYQTGSANILSVIASSPTSVEPVLNAIVDHACEICEASDAVVYMKDGDHLRADAHRGPIPIPTESTRLLISRDWVTGRSVVDMMPVHVRDFDSPEGDEFPVARLHTRLMGHRAALAVPLLREGEAIGAIALRRTEIKPFTDQQIALLQTFADQAVIAIENTRLFDETQAALERQTATADVLKVISRSSVELGSVLHTLVQTVARLCRADQVYMFHLRHDLWHLVADCGLSAEARDFFRNNPFIPGRGSTSGRAALERRAVLIPDVLQDPEYTLSEGQEIAGYRTTLGIPLLREDTLIGVYSITRTRVESFTDNEIELATTFADQAVIAIENARLFDELRERQAELRVTFDNMGDGVVMFGADTRLIAWNRNFQEILDLPDAFFAQRPSYADYFRYLAERGEYSADLEAQLSSTLDDTSRELRFERTRPDGRVIEVRRNPVAGGGFVMIYSDISERKRAEEQIRAARDAAEKALRELQTAQASLVHAQKMAALGQVTAGIAHEIKNPLNFVNNFAGLSIELLDELKEAARAVGALDLDKRAEIVETIRMLTGNLEKIVEHGRRADGIVRSMLQHSRGSSDDRQPTDLNTLTEEALNLAYHGARAQDPNFDIALERDLDSNLGPVDVVPQELTRVLLNLIGNGLYAANKRCRESDGTYRPALRVTTREFGESVEVRVRDNGIGVPPENRDKLFQPFFTTKPTGEGTGLGLSISYEIVTHQHGGTITFDSEVGDFTEFTVRLPRRRHAGVGKMG